MNFSIVVPTHNRLVFLRKALPPLFNQAYPSSGFEIIVVDDGSADGTREYLSCLNRANFLFLTQARRGPAAARNLAAHRTQGQFLAFTDDDCLASLDWLESLERGFTKWTEAAAVGGFLEASEEVLKKNLLAQLEAYETHQVYGASAKEYLGGFESPAGGTNNIAYRREIFERLGGFDESFPVPAGEDADLKYRAVQAGYAIGYLPMKMTHLDPYSGGTFWRRSIRAGIGSAYFERKNFGKIDSRITLLVSFLKSLLRLPVFVLVGRRPQDWRLRVLMGLKEMLMIYGRLGALRGVTPI